MCKYLVLSGGVVSGVGKGVSAASLALLLKMRGERIQMIKFDPYLNISSSLLAPAQHGEVYLCDDGSETDLDLGTYYRLSGIDMSEQNICTSGKLYQEILTDEIHGKFMGQTVQLMPHVTDRVIEKLEKLGADADIVIIEIGGTVGDFESGVFYEAIRQLRQKSGESNFLLVHVAPILWINTLQEFKTKPLQNSVRELQRLGLNPDMLLCRTEKKVPIALFDKISQMTGVPKTAIFEAPDVKTIYQVPLEFYDRHADDFIADKFHLRRNGVRIHSWRTMVDNFLSPDREVLTVGVVGKYTNVSDAYLSLKEAIQHAATHNGVKVDIKWIDSQKLEEYSTLRGLEKFFEGVNAIIVPGGFDNRGVEGKIRAVRYAREKKIPFLGICLGLQCAVIEYARNVLGVEKANSAEFDENCVPVVHFVKGLESIRKGGTLRLGAFDCSLDKESIIGKLYNKRLVSERHRHRYEVNAEYVSKLEENGLVVSGINPETGLVECMELKSTIHPHFTSCQFHPEFKSRFECPHPLFLGLLNACKKEDIADTEVKNEK